VAFVVVIYMVGKKNTPFEKEIAIVDGCHRHPSVGVIRIIYIKKKQ